MTNEKAFVILNDKDTIIKNPNYQFTEIYVALNIARECLKERIAIDHETMKADFEEIKLRGIENSDLQERFNETYCSCLNCKNQHTSYCEPQNKKIYGYCGNWERR